MSGELGKASLDLEANLGPFERNLESAHASSDRLEHALDALAAVADVCQKALNDVKLDASHAAESRVTAEQIISGVRGISDESRTAARELDRVKLGSEQADETVIAGGLIDHVLDNIHDRAERTKRALDGVRLRLAEQLAEGRASNRPGYGVGPFGAGYGRVGLVGSAISLGVATAGVTGPAVLGLLAAIPALATMGAGALGTLALAFHGVGKAISGDKKAFDDLTPAAQKFVLTIRSLDGFFDRLRQTAATSLFPGLTAGLKAALSPGTVNALYTAITQIGRAIGAVGAEFGRYFGSKEFQSIFGPLMASAARNIGVLGDAFLHLFDALGVVSRAAIPFVNWLATAIDKGAKLADSFIHAKDASGQLGKGVGIAEQSLRLLGGLVEALIKTVVALGVALYPVGKVIVTDLTRGLNALAGVIHRNQSFIREFVGTALKVFVTAVKAAADGVGTIFHALEKLVGQKAIIIGVIAAIGVALALALGPYSATVAGVLIAVGLIKDHWKTVKAFFVNLGHEIVNAFEYVWYLLEKGAIKAALAVVEPFSHLPGFLGGWARTAKNRMQGQLDKLHAPNMDWRSYAASAGAATGAAWANAFDAAAAKGKLRIGPGGNVYAPHFFHTDPSGKHRRRHRHATPTLSDVFGPPPPFTSNTGSGSGSHSAIPNAAAALEAEANRQEQAAAALNFHGKRARQHLDKEIVDLQKADRILEEKLKHAHGRKRIEIYNQITANLRKIAEARKRLHQTIQNTQQQRLDYALDEAKAAVEHAKKGSAAYDRAIKREEEALRKEIAYWTKRAHNMHLSIKQRDEALRKEIAYQKQLNSLLKPQAQAAAANEMQFLSSFNDIQNAFGSNVQPVPNQDNGKGKTDTHLYEIKHEARKQTRHLQALRDRSRFPHSELGLDAAMAVTG